MKRLKPEIAVLGYACRLPGAPSPEAFWRLLETGNSAISEIGPDRWSTTVFCDPNIAAKGRSYSAAAGLVPDIWDFDPALFSISPREAAQMDPQQRLLLQVAWEAIEHAGLTRDDLAGTRSGVFVGASSLDHAHMISGDPAAADLQFMTGNTLSVLSNRIAHFLDIRGPSCTYDTACASSLFALHYACEAVNAGEIDFAIVGGVNALLSPVPFVGFSRAGMLSRQGRCCAFDAEADGYVRAEGAVAIVIGRPAQARRAGLRPRSLLRGSAIGTAGHSPALAVPSETAQAEVMRRAMERAGVTPDDYVFVEAHGTGTQVGDAIEAGAIGHTIGARRRDALPIGSAKTNVGHLEPVSGLVGLLKAQLALEQGVFPPSLNIESPNPRIPFDELRLQVASSAMTLPSERRPWFAGVNSFGFGGANAHVILSEVTENSEPAAKARRAKPEAPLILSAATKESLRRLAQRWSARLKAATAAEAAELTNAAAYRRSRLPYGLAVGGVGPAELAEALDRFAEGARENRIREGFRPNTEPGGIGFAFSGNGSQWAGMGRAAFDRDAVFRRSFRKVASVIRDVGGPDLGAALADPALGDRLKRASLAQPLLMAVQIAIVEALGARGIRPQVVVGHSVGEVAAAWCAGILDLESAAHLAVRRSVLQEPLYRTGRLVAALGSVQDMSALIEELGLETLCIAAENSPRSVTLSGDNAAIEAFVRHSRRARIAYRELAGDYPFHSPMMETIRADLLSDLGDIRPSPGTMHFASSVLGDLAKGDQLTADYWWRNAREPVRFHQAILAAAETGIGVMVEISPKTALRNYLRDTVDAASGHLRVVQSQHGHTEKDSDFALVAAEIVLNGGKIDERRLFGPRRPLHTDLPSYPWENREFRLESSADAININRDPAPRPMLGWRAVDGEGAWHLSLDLERDSWLADHRLEGTAVVPAAFLLELFLAAAEQDESDGIPELSDIEFLSPIMLGSQSAVDIRLTPESGGTLLTIEHRPRLGAGPWTLTARASVRRANAAPAPQRAATLPEQAQPAIAPDRLYKSLRDLGLGYGPAFRLVREAQLSANDARLTLAKPSVLTDMGCALNPTSVDAAFHGLLPLIGARRPQGGRHCAFVPSRIEKTRLYAPGRAVSRARVTLVGLSERQARADVRLIDAEGGIVADLGGVHFTELPLRARRDPGAAFWRQRWLRLRDGGLREPWLAAAWQVPMERLRAIGLVQDVMPEPDAGALLIDAACRRLVWDACRHLADADRRVDFGQTGQLSEQSHALLRRGSLALAEDGAFDPVSGQLSDAAPVPAWQALIAELVRVAPERAVELGAVLKLRRIAMGEEAGELSGAELRPNAATHWAALHAAVEALLGDMPPGASVDLLILGDAPSFLIEALDRFDGIGRLVCGIPGGAKAPAPHPKAVWLPLEDALVNGHFDIILGADLPEAATPQALAAAMAPGSLFLAVEPCPNLYSDLIAAAAGDAQPLPPALDRALELDQQLADAGFQVVAQMPLSRTATEGKILTARAPLPHGDAIARLVVGGNGATGFTAPRIVCDTTGPGRADGEALAARLGRPLHLGDTPWQPPESTDEAQEPADAIFFVGCTPECAAVPQIRDRLDQVRRLLAAPGLERLWLVTRGGRPVAAGDPMPAAARRPVDAALWAAMRVLRNERPALDIRGVDFDPATSADEVAAKLTELLLHPGDESEIAVTPAGDFTLRVEQAADIARNRGNGDQPGESLALKLTAPSRAALRDLAWTPVARRAPGPGEVEIEIRAAGLNFRDVMCAMHMLPPDVIDEGFAGTSLGMECAGVVVRSGPGSRFAAGDRVMGFAAAALATHVTVPETALVAIPPEAEFLPAAAAPVIFATAWHALAEVAALKQGETVLIHGGAGGVGLAALQVAKHLGARVIATAGTPEKRALLGVLGADHVFDSRDLGFADAVMNATGGAGVDVALNSLSGEAMQRTLECLRSFGRFVELGKRDFAQNTRIGLRLLRKNISYFAIDLDQIVSQRPDKAQALLGALEAAFREGTLRVPPYRRFDSDRAADAFRLLQQSGHIGKVLISPPKQTPTPHPATDFAIRPEAAYLVAGGLGGLGLATAQWLADRGARHIWLASRSGKPLGDTARTVEMLRAGGVTVHCVATDLADPAQVTALIGQIEAGGKALRGVVHSAMVLDDALIGTLTPERVERVLQPKVAGLDNLDRATRGGELDFFVAYSSVAGLIGNPGQAAYAAANAYMEAMIAVRRAERLPGLAVALGPIFDAGHLTRDTATRERLGRYLDDGFMRATEALHLVELALAAGDGCDPVITAAPLRWGRLACDLPVVGGPLFERVDRSGGEDLDDASSSSLAALVKDLDENAAIALLVKYLRREIARILQQPEDEIDLNRSMADLGFDSLLAVELKLALDEKFGASLASFGLSEGVTLRDIAVQTVRALKASTAAPGEAQDAVVARLKERHLAGTAVDPEVVGQVVARSEAIKRVVR